MKIFGIHLGRRRRPEFQADAEYPLPNVEPATQYLAPSPGLTSDETIALKKTLPKFKPAKKLAKKVGVKKYAAKKSPAKKPMKKPAPFKAGKKK